MKTLQNEVLKRFMNAEDYDKLIQSYQASLKRVYKSRKDSLSEEISPIDLEMVHVYLSQLDTPVGELAKKYNLSEAAMNYRVVKTALRIVYQNQGKM